MFNVHFFENKDHVLSQKLESVPAQGDDIKIKGRKGKVIIVTNLDDKKTIVQVVLEKVKKNKLFVDPKKKKR